jgi:hypothetical protein
MPFYRRRRTRRTFRKKPTVRRAVKRVKTTNFNQKVMRVIKSNNETKMKVWNIYNNQSVKGTGLYKGDTSSSRGLYVANLLGATNIKGCNLTRGTNQEQFIGNQITNAKITLRGVVYSLPYANNSNPCQAPFELHIIFYKNKTTNAADPNSLLEYPNNTIGHIANVNTSCYPFNRDAYIIKKRLKFVMRAMPMERDGIESIQNPQTSNAMMFKRFSITLPLRKLIKYNDSEVSPENEWLGMGIYVLNGDGSDNDESQYRASVYMDGTIRFQDA